MEPEYILEMKGICKNFPGVKALDNVDFMIKKGEVHALMGENGAGKSTLIKVLTGIYAKDAGTVSFMGQKVDINSVIAAQRAGISTIYQEINLIPQLSVAENLFIGREIKKRRLIDIRAQKSQSEKILGELGLKIDVTRTVSSYGIAVQQMITIARAVSLEAKLVIMDEPTSSLSDDEVNLLFKVIYRLKELGIAVLFITHRLGEMFTICDSVTILKDGVLVGRYDIRELTMADLVAKMVGRDAAQLGGECPMPERAKGEVILEARNIQSGAKVCAMNLKIHRGEVVGLAGLLGSGRTEFARALFGAAPIQHGEVAIAGQSVKLKSPRDAIRRGLAYLPESRKIDGIFPNLSVRENLCIVNLKRLSKWGILNKNQQSRVTDEYIAKIKIKTPHREQAMVNLSGGNQQKVLLSRWLALGPKLIILDEPTTGIDVGAKAEIEALIRQMAAAGIGVLFISSELDELARNCDRIEVIREGRNIGTLCGDAICKQAITDTLAREGGVPHCS